MKMLWTDEELNPRRRSRFDRFCDVSVALAALYFGTHFLIWIVR